MAGAAAAGVGEDECAASAPLLQQVGASMSSLCIRWRRPCLRGFARSTAGAGTRAGADAAVVLPTPAEPEEGVGELDEVAAPEAGPDAEMPAAEQQPLQEEPQALAGSNGAAAEAPAPAEQQQEQHLAAAEEAAAPAVAVPAFLAAAVAVQGADAEVEDYDE